MLDGLEVHDVWTEPGHDQRVVLRVLVDAGNAQSVMDALERQFHGREDFRVVLLNVHATLPRPKEPEPGPEDEHKNSTGAIENGNGESAKKASPSVRVGREELLAALESGTRVDTDYLAMTILAAIVAAIGLFRGSVAVIIGAMVIAPLLAPNMALALATTLGDRELAKRSVRTNATGLLLAFAFATILGLALPVVDNPEIVSRTAASIADVVLALAAGCAGALAFTAGAPAGLVGVMVAVSLMPPLVVAGLMVGAGRFGPAGGALLLLAMNIICVNLAAVATFLCTGVSPRTWWEKDKARRASRRAVIAWSVLLVLLVLIVALGRG